MDKTLQKGLILIEALARSDKPRGVTDLARESSFTKSNVHRLLQTLHAQGIVKHDPESGTYSLSLRLWELGCLVLARLDLKQQAAPHLERLADQTRETVHLSLLDGGEVVYIDKIDSPEPVRAYSRIGGRAPGHCVATGKVLLAYQPPAAIEKLGSSLPRFTSRTIGSPAALAREFSRIREVGYAINRGEWRDRVCGLAAPIRDGSDTVIAAIGISGPADRLKARRLKDLAPSVVEAARTISRSLGAPVERNAEGERSARREHQRASHAAIVGH